jgi:hypothetical protein
MSIECKSFRSFEKGMLRGFCELYLPTVGMTIANVSLLENEKGERWLSMPARAYEDRQSGETKYSPLIRFDDRTYRSFQQQALAAVEEFMNKQNLENPGADVDDSEIPF